MPELSGGSWTLRDEVSSITELEERVEAQEDQINDLLDQNLELTEELQGSSNENADDEEVPDEASESEDASGDAASSSL